MATTNAFGLFNTNSQGYTQGDAMDDPAVKFALAGGVLSTSATSPLWGGLPIQEFSPAATSQPGTNTLGSTILQATGSANPTGISVFNQAFAGITTPQSTAPLYSPGMSVNFYRFGSGARIPLVLNPASLSIEGELISTTVYWDYTNNWLTTTQPGTQAALPVKVLNVSTVGNKVVSYNGTTGNANWTNFQSDGVTPAVVALCLI
jgi:hypothetical protein